jgi:uncharacterized protein
MSRSEPKAAPEGERLVELVCRARQGDGVAFAGLVEVHGPALDRFCRRLMPEPGAAQDLAQETLLRGFQALPRLEDPARFGAWLCGIAANLARWWWRRQARWPVSLDDLAEAYPDVPRVAWAASLPATPEQAVERAEQTRRLAAAIESLPPALARAVALHYLGGLSYAEAAAALDVPVSTLKGRLFKSRTRLRRALDPDGRAPPRARQPRPAHRRKEPPAMAAATETADARLVPVTVECIYQSGVEPTPERVRGALQHLFVAGAAPGPAGAADLTPVAEQLLAAAAAPGLALRAGPRALLLKERDGARAVPIVVGVPEAEAVAVQLQGHTTPRPLSYDLMRRLLEAGGLRVQQAAVTRLEADTYYATVTLQTPAGRTVELDARPSDAVNLALRTEAPLYVAAGLLLSPEAAQRFLERFGTQFEGFGTRPSATPPA